MNEYDVRRLALVLALQANIEGMKSDNMLADKNGHPPIHTQSDFDNMAGKLSDLAYAHNEQLF
jgi:hypothetical protein